MDYRQDPLYAQFKKDEQQKNKTNINSQADYDYKKDPLYAEFKKSEAKKYDDKLKKFNEYIPDFAEDFVQGSAKGIADYTASAAKLFGNRDLQYRARQASNTFERNTENKYVGIAGEMLGDPLNLTPAGIFTKGAKGARIAKSMGAGAAIGAGTMAAKDYGNEEMTTSQKVTDAEIGAGFVSGINGIIAALTKGRVNNAIKPEMVQGKSEDEIAKSILRDRKNLGLDEQEAQAVHAEILQGKYPKVDEKFKIEKAGFGKQYTPNFQMRPNNPPATMDINTALAVLAREADKRRIAQGLEPIYQQKFQVQPQFRKESIYPPQQEHPYTPNFVSGDFNKNIPVPYNADAELMQRYHKIAAHPRLQELLDMRETVSAKDARSPKILLQKGAGRELDGYGGENKHAYDNAQYDKNYAYDFHLTKQDIGKLYRGQYDDNILSKLEADLDTLDNHPDYAIPYNSGNNIDYKAELETLDNTNVKMADDDWEEANMVFSKGIDNLAAGTFAGIDEDENGNITFDPEKFILGLGGYTAVKQALKNGTIRGKLKDAVIDAIDMVNFNPEVQKANGINAMSPVKSKVQKEKRGIYNVTYNGKNSTEVRKADSEELIRYAKGNKNQGAIHIKKHLQDGSVGEVSKEELLNIGNIIRNGKVYENHGKNVYELEKDGVRYRVVTGKGKNDNEKIITFYSDRNLEEKKGYEISLITDNSSSNSKIIPQKQEKQKGLLARVAEQKRLDGLPEKGRKVYHPLREKEYYLGDSGTVYFKRGNGTYKEMPNEEIRKDIHTIAKIGTNKFKAQKLAQEKDLENSFKNVEEAHKEDSYKMEHTAPVADEVNSRADNVANSFGDDIYSKYAQRLHGHGSPAMDKESIEVINKVKDNPNAEVTIYRAIPKDVDAGINPKDWVTISKEYAKTHGENVLNGSYKIVEQKVKAKDLWTDGNSIHEWGYDPHTEPTKLMANGMHSMAGAFAGGSDSLINQRDYNDDGKTDITDILIGAGIGAAGINALKKAAPKLFEEEAQNGGFRAGLFAGSKAKGFKEAEKGGKVFDGKYDTLERFEIDDSKAKIKATAKDINELKKEDILKEEQKIEELFDNGKISEDEYIKSMDEIDKKFLMTNSKNGTYKLADIFEHSDFYKNYPDAKNIKVTFNDMPKGANGYYDAKNNEIVLNSNMSKDEIKSSLLHELQHSIQKKEGFARGGSAQEFYNEAKRKIDLLRYELEFEPDDFIRDKKLRQLDELEKEFKNGGEDKAFNMYKRLAGEIEARDVQARAELTPEQRAKTEPYSSENIAKEDAILKFNNADDEIVNGLKQQQAKDLEDKYLNKKTDKVLENEILKEAKKLPNEKSFSEFKSDFNTNGWTSLETPIGKVSFNVSSVYKHFTDNTYFQDRKWLTGAFKDALTDPLFVIKNKKKNQIEYYKPYKNENGIVHYIGIIKDNKGKLRQITSFDKEISSIKQMIKTPDGNLLYYKHSSGIKNPTYKGKTSDTAKGMENQSAYDKIIPQKDKNGLQKSENFINDDGNIADKAIRKTVVETYKLLDKAVEKVVGKSITDAFEKVKESDYTDAVTGHKIYEKKDYMNWRDEALRERAEKGYELEQLHKKLAELSTDTNRKLYEYMTGNKNVDLSPSLKKLGDKFISDIDKKGKELVEQGILSNETFETWKGRYLKRTYGSKIGSAKNAYHRAKGKTIDPIIARGKIWTGTKEELEKYKKEGMIGSIADGKIEYKELRGKIQFRRDWTPDERASMGEIKDASYAIPLTISKLDELVAHSKLLDKVAGKYVLSAKEIENLTEAQIKNMGYVKLSGERYGSLNGKWVDKSVAADIQELNTQLNGVDGSVQSAIADYFKWYKSIHTIYNPKTHMNNILSNIIGFSFMDGKTLGVLKTVMPELKKAVLPTSITTKAKSDTLIELEAKASVGSATNDDLKKLNELRNDNDVKLWMEAKKSGLFGQNHLNDTLNSYLQPQVKKTDGVLNKIHNKAGEVYQFEDDIVRFALYKQFKKAGFGTKQAVKKVGEIVPDYSKPMSKVANWLRRYGVAPFIAFPYYGTPIMMKQIAKRPTRPIALAATIYGLYMAQGINPIDESAVPERFSKSYVPLGRKGDKVYGLKYDRWIPHLDLLKLHKMPLDVMWGQNPYASALGGLMGLVEGNGGYSPYFNGKITHKKGLEGRMDVAGSMLSGFVTPDILDSGYGVLSSLIESEKKRRRNRVYNPKSTGQNILNALGLNTTSYNISQQRKKYRRDTLK